MAEADAITEPGAVPPPPPPRRKTRLARYTRRSKLITTALSLVGAASLIFLASTMMPEDKEGAELLKRHKPAVHGVDSMGKMSPSVTGNGNGGDGTPAENGGDDGETMNRQDDHGVTLTPAPSPEVVEYTNLGELPRISDGGRAPWQIYARPFNAEDPRPRIAIVVAGLGAQKLVAEDAVTRLPVGVTLAFEAENPTVGAWMARARQEGHEVLLSVPMEPFDFPQSDPGPNTLLTNLPDETNLLKLHWAMRQGSGYVGLTTLTGTRFTTETPSLKLVMKELQKRGLLILDARIAPRAAIADVARDLHVPAAIAGVRIDDSYTPEAMDAALQQLIQDSKTTGRGVAVVIALPGAMEHLQNWLKTLPRQGIALAPVSAVVQ